MEIFQEYSLASLSFTLGYCLFGRWKLFLAVLCSDVGSGKCQCGLSVSQGGVGFVLLLEGTKVTKSWAPAAHPAWMPSCPRQPEGSAFILLKTSFHLWLCCILPSLRAGPEHRPRKTPRTDFPVDPTAQHPRLLSGHESERGGYDQSRHMCLHLRTHTPTVVRVHSVLHGLPQAPPGASSLMFLLPPPPFPTEPLCSGSP